MRIEAWMRALLAALVLALPACASVSTRETLDDVERLVAERGLDQFEAPRESADDPLVRERVECLLAGDLTLDEAIRISLVNNRGLRAAYESLSLAQSDLVAAGLLGNPVLDVEARFSGSGTSLELSIVQDFLDLLFLSLRKKVASSALEAVKLESAGAVLDLAGRVKAAYYRAQAAEQTLEAKRHVLAATEAAYDLAKRLRKAGNVRELDLLGERSLYEQSKLDVRSAELAVTRSRENLTSLMGLWGSDTAWRIAPRLPEPPPEEPDASALEGGAVEKSLELAALRHEMEKASAAIGLAGPPAVLGGTHLGASGEREADGEWAVGPALSVAIPLFDFGQPSLASARARFRRAAELHAATAVELRSRVRSARSTLVAARETVDYHRKVLLPLRERIVGETQLLYNAMQVGTAELLHAKQQQISAGDVYVGALLEYWLARTELDQLLAGRMTGFGFEGPRYARRISSR